MATIQSAIELQDNFTNILYQVIDSVNLGLAAMEDLHQTMNAPVDTTSIEAARESINRATLAVQELDAAMQGMENQDTGSPAPVDLPVNPDVPEPFIPPPEPVPVPIHWQSNNLEVFTSTGIERFEREIQSANNMLNTLNTTQSRIVQTAAQTDLFPEDAVADMNQMQNRLQAIWQRIQTIESNPLNMGTETANAELEQLRGQLDQAIREQEELNRAVENMDVQAANEAYLRLSQIIGNTERYIRDNMDEQRRFNQEIGQGTNKANSLIQAIKGAVAAYATIQTLSTALSLSDQLASTTARLNLMNDGLQTTQELQEMIYLSAERARGSYQATADAVAKLGLMAGDAFGSSEEIVAFMEQVNKQFTIAGTEAAGVEAAMLQLTQAMGSGVLRGEEYNSILEQAPNIIQAIADYMEVPKGQLKDMAAEGQITADIVKAAMFAAAEDTNAKFESMPETFSQVWESFQNQILVSIQPLLGMLNDVANSDAVAAVLDGIAERVSTLVNSEEITTLIETIISGLEMISWVAFETFDLLTNAASVVADNWSWLSPIIYGIVAALLVYAGSLAIVKIAEMIGTAVKIAMCLASYAHAAATGAEVSATAEATAAQYGLNTAILSCPIVWIIVLIIALVALFYAVVAAINKFAGTSVSATGIICGVFMFALALIGNLLVTLANFIIDVWGVIWNFIAAFANFLANVFDDPVGSIARLFFDLADAVLGVLETLASAIDTIFGSNLAGAVSGWRNSLGSWVDDTFGQGKEFMKELDTKELHLDRFEYGSAFDAGYSFGSGIDESIANFDPSSLFGTDDIPSTDDYTNDFSNGGTGAGDIGGVGGAGGLGDIGSGVEDIAGDTGAIADAMDVTEEELKYLRDIAEQEVVNRFTTAEIQIEQTNNNNFKNGNDLDGIVSGLTDAVNEAVGIMVEGVHE